MVYLRRSQIARNEAGQAVGVIYWPVHEVNEDGARLLKFAYFDDGPKTRDVWIAADDLNWVEADPSEPWPPVDVG